MYRHIEPDKQPHKQGHTTTHKQPHTNSHTQTETHKQAFAIHTNRVTQPHTNSHTQTDIRAIFSSVVSTLVLYLKEKVGADAGHEGTLQRSALRCHNIGHPSGGADLFLLGESLVTGSLPARRSQPHITSASHT